MCTNSCLILRLHWYQRQNATRQTLFVMRKVQQNGSEQVNLAVLGMKMEKLSKSSMFTTKQGNKKQETSVASAAPGSGRE